MSMPMQFWFEFASTYSYLAASRIEQLARDYHVVLEWKPFLLGPIFAAQGWKDSPFNLYDAKGRYMWRDLERICEQLDIPFKRPSRFPANSLLAARVACYGERQSWIGAFVRAVYRANFAEQRDISDPVVVADCLADAGQSASIIEMAQAPEHKGALRANTEEAQRLGIFGAPSFVVDGELFWGNDRLEQALEWATR